MQRSSSTFSYIDSHGFEVMEFLESDDEDDSVEVLPTPKPNRTRQATSSQVSVAPAFMSLDDDDTEHDEEDLPELSQLTQSSVAGPSRASSTRSDTYLFDDPASPSEDGDNSPIISRKRKSPSLDYRDNSDRDATEATPVKKKARTKKDPEQTKREKEAKAAAKKAEAERKKAEKAAEKARKAEEKAAEKADKAAHKKANVLITSKRDTVADMTIEIHPDLANQGSLFQSHVAPLIQRISTEAKEKPRMRETPSWPIAKMVPEQQFQEMKNLIRWKKNVKAIYDQEEREWKVVPEPYDRIEGSYMLYFPLRALLDELRIPNPADRPSRVQLTKLRSRLGRLYQLFLLVDASSARKLSGPDKEVLDAWLAELQIEFSCFICRAEDQKKVVQWLYNITADLGLKPHKLIERSHLPFCSQTKAPKDAEHNYDDDGRRVKTQQMTYRQMLEQISRLTGPMAREITRDPQFATFRALFETYTDPQASARDKEEMLIGVSMGATAKSGIRTTRNIGKILSHRVHQVFTSQDSLQLVAKGKD